MNSDILVSNIQRFSLDDGPGIRTTVFFKGCNLKCHWCHNPECISFVPELEFHSSRCTLCGKCAAVCTQGVHSFAQEQHLLGRSRCIACGKCVETCSNEALAIIGKAYSADEIMNTVLKDTDFYKASGGGVTFSGGEPMLALPLLKELLARCKQHDLHTAVDTAGNVGFDSYLEIIPYTDLFLIDLKIWNDEKHRLYTEASNKLIKENIRRISDENKSIIIRIPIVGSVNDDFNELGNIAEFLKSIKKIELVQLLPYHQYGIGKYKLIGMDSEQDSFYIPSAEFMQKGLELFKQRGINVSF